MTHDRRFLALLRPRLGLLVLALLASALTAAFDGATIVLLIPFLRTMFGSADQLAAGGTVLEGVVERWITPVAAGPNGAVIVIALLLGALICKNLAHYLHAQTIVRIQEGVVGDLRKRLFAHLLTVNLGVFQRTRFGQLVSALVADADQARQAIPALLSMLLQNLITVVAGLAILASISLRLTALALLATPVLLVGIQFLLIRVRRMARARAEERGQMTAVASERLGAVKLIRVSGTEATESAGFAARVDALRKQIIRTQRLASLSGPITEVFAGAILLLIVWGATMPGLVGTTIGPEATVAFLLAALKTMSPLKSLSSFPPQWAQAMAGADRVFRFLDLPSVEREPPGQAEANFSRDIIFDGVDFRYRPSEPLVLSGISFRVARGSIVALVGPSGAGKTTLVEMLPRFWDPVAGEIRLDGVPLTRLSRASLRRLMAVVGQETVLLNDTVHHNIAYGMPGATRAEVEAAAEAANAAEFIRKLPEGYDTALGERGSRLSGGQRQRIAIARALLRDAPILILDEATSALDTESERLVQEAIDRLVQHRTVFVIAHRLATIRNATQLLVLDQGRIVEQGTHEELFRAGGLYRRLHDLQFAPRGDADA